MGCVASAVALREKRKAAVAPLPSPNTLRGDLLSRNEARQQREKSVADHHAKAKKMGKAMAYNTMAEKEMMSTSTEQSYRSGRGFLISGQADNNATDEGSSSTMSERANPLIQQAAPTTDRMEAVTTTSTHLPYSVLEEESLHQHNSNSVKGHRSDADETDLHVHVCSNERTQDCSSEDGSNSQTGMDTSMNVHQVKGRKAEVSLPDGDSELKSKKPVKVRFVDDRTGVAITSEDEQTDSITMATADSQPDG